MARQTGTASRNIVYAIVGFSLLCPQWGDSTGYHLISGVFPARPQIAQSHRRHFEHGLHCTKWFPGRYETILWFTKSNNYTFNLDPVRVLQKYPGKKHLKGPKAGQYSCNPLGKNPDDDDLWAILNVLQSNHVEKKRTSLPVPSRMDRTAGSFAFQRKRLRVRSLFRSRNFRHCGGSPQTQRQRAEFSPQVRRERSSPNQPRVGRHFAPAPGEQSHLCPEASGQFSRPTFLGKRLPPTESIESTDEG